MSDSTRNSEVLDEAFTSSWVLLPAGDFGQNRSCDSRFRIVRKFGDNRRPLVRLQPGPLHPSMLRLGE